jgi:hypothetical protein
LGVGRGEGNEKGGEESRQWERPPQILAPDTVLANEVRGRRARGREGSLRRAHRGRRERAERRRGR